MNVLKLAQSMVSASGGNQSLYNIINDLGLTANLKVCLDAGDSASYNPSVQTAKWLDTSGNGYDFYRGSSTSGDAAEPTFNGSAGGKSSSEYWSFDGGDYFLYDTTNETWMNNLHKAAAKYSMLCVAYVPNLTVSQYMFATRGASGAGMTNNIVRGSTGKMLAYVSNSGNRSVILKDSTLALNNTAWNVTGVVVDESAATGRFFVNGTNETFTSTYSSPDTGSAAAVAAIASTGGGATKSPSGSRIACLAVWEGVALTSTNLTDIHNAIKGRFGL